MTDRGPSIVRSPDHPIARSRVVSVALPLPIRKSFSYGVPASLPMPDPGSRVRVPFGERVLTGVVLAQAGEQTSGIREIVEVLDAEPVCPPELLATADRVARRSFASTGEVLKAALPARLPAAGAVRYRITEKGALARAGGAEEEILEQTSRRRGGGLERAARGRPPGGAAVARGARLRARRVLREGEKAPFGGRLRPRRRDARGSGPEPEGEPARQGCPRLPRSSRPPGRRGRDSDGDRRGAGRSANARRPRCAPELRAGAKAGGAGAASGRPPGLPAHGRAGDGPRGDPPGDRGTGAISPPSCRA